ncbi:MAG: penicillin-binding protein 2 [Candidatus Cloacimonetes bacterium]|nr:penicillin-binding protein 2 [Candidatus Cloacimonadota bacterium]
MIFKRFKKEDYYFGVVIIIFIILLNFLFRIQVIEGRNYQEIAEENYFRKIKKCPKRGIIYDRNLQPLLENVPSLAVYIDIEKIKDKEKLAEFLAENLSIKKGKVFSIIYQHSFRKFAPILIDDEVDLATAIKFEENMDIFPSIIVKSESRRNYLYNDHFLGYVGKISKEEYKLLKTDEYDNIDYIGKVGLEKYYEKDLKGEKGFDIVQVDASGSSLGLIRGDLSKPPISGKDLVLTVDIDLQTELTNLLPKDLSSAAVVMDCRTGGIIASASTPSYNQNMFVSGMNTEYWQTIVNDKNNPLLNKVCNATYPPGSIFKLLVAAYVLEKELVEPYEILVDCEGGVEYGGRFFGCWKKTGHGPVNLLDAIRVSCDTYFYKLAEMINLDDFKKFVDDCRITCKSEIDIMSERKGFFPTSFWYNENYSEFGWTRGHLLNLAIGQGEVLVTPLSMARFYSSIANGGILLQPHLLDYYFYKGEKEKIEYDKTKLPIKQETLEFLKLSLDEAVNAKGRTGGMARVKGVRIGGKTGSAENYKGDTHAWFAAIAPLQNPEIAVVVFIENGGSGAGAAAPLAGKIMAHYFNSEPILVY